MESPGWMEARESFATRRMKLIVAKKLGCSVIRLEAMGKRSFEDLAAVLGLGPSPEVDPNKADTSLVSPPSPLMDLNFPTLRETQPATLDIHFLFQDEDTGAERKLGAHKLLLALSSEVFMNQFFTQFAEAKQGAVNITDSSFHSFKIFLDHIYDIKIPWSELSHTTLYQLFHLANKYQIGSLAKSVCQCVSEMEVTSGNVLEVASIAQSVKSINAEQFSDSLDASVLKIKSDTFNEILGKEFDKEEMKLLHKFFGGMDDSKGFRDVKQELNLRNISNLLSNQPVKLSILSSFIESNLPMRVTELFSKVPCEDNNTSQLFTIIKLGFKSFEVQLEQLDGRQVTLRLCPWETIYSVKEKVKKAQPGHISCKMGDVDVVSVVEKQETVFSNSDPSCKITLKTETKLEKEDNIVLDFDIKSMSHKLVQKSTIITVIQRFGGKKVLGIKVSSGDTIHIQDIKVKVNVKLGEEKRRELKITTFSKSNNFKILQDTVTVKDLVLKEKYWGKLLACYCSPCPEGNGCIYGRPRSNYDSDDSDEDEDHCNCTCHH